MLDFIQIPTPCITSLAGLSMELHALCVLSACRNTSTNRSHLMSKTQIADLAGISRRHIYRVLNNLEEMNLIELVAERRGEYMYYLKCLEWLKAEKTNDAIENEIAELTKIVEAI